VAQLAVLSNGDQQQQEQEEEKKKKKKKKKVSRTGLGHYIVVVLTSDQLGMAKPDPRVFESACGRLGVTPHAAVYVGDQTKVDSLCRHRRRAARHLAQPQGNALPPRVKAIDDLAELPSDRRSTTDLTAANPVVRVAVHDPAPDKNAHPTRRVSAFVAESAIMLADGDSREVSGGVKASGS
jgi:Haloacid dehalogenase-like hydrolase